VSTGSSDRSIVPRSAAREGGPGTASIGRAPERTPLWGLLEVTTPLPQEPASLDEVDRRLLALLAADSRASQRKLARDLHMSPPAVGERIARLERVGVIRGYTVRIDWTALGYENVVLAVTAQPGADQAAVLQALGRLPEVEEVIVVTGSMDMLARLRVRDHAHLRQVLLSEIWRIEGVQRTETFVGLAEMPAKESYVAGLLDSPRGGRRE
jgi:Lrp/AsnC family transcriptional regulator, leucine-responsive regulatory protein